MFIASTRDRSSEVYSQKLTLLKKATQQVKLIFSECDVDVMAFILHTVKKNAKHNKVDHRYLDVYQKIDTEDITNDLKKILLEFQMAGQPVDNEFDLTSATAPLHPVSLYHQIKVVSGISNYHWGVDKDKNPAHVGYLQRLCCETNPKVFPFSKRNRIMFFTARGEMDKVFNTLQMPDSASFCQYTSGASSKKRKFTHRIEKVTSSMLMDAMGMEIAPVNSVSHFDISQYQQFKLDIAQTTNSLLWRYHGSDREVFTMTSYCPEKGLITPLSFVHITLLKTDDSFTVLCECPTFRILQDTVDPHGTENIGLRGISCMHCRYFQEEILPNFSGGSLHISKQFLNCGVVLLTPQSSFGTLKYSVLGKHEDLSFVHFSKLSNLIKCQSGKCSVGSIATKSIQKFLALDQTKDLCEHLSTFKSNEEVWRNVIGTEEELNDSDVTDGDICDVESETENVEDSPTPFPVNSSATNKHFDTVTGKWNFGGLSTHKPSTDGSDKLTQNIQERMQIHDRTCKRDHDGFFLGDPLIPKCPETCECGAGYKNIVEPDGVNLTSQFPNHTHLYTRHGAVRCKVYKRRCEALHCELLYTGEDDSIFFWTAETAVADEIGYDFFRRLLLSKLTFSAYCTDLTRIFKSINAGAAPFLSKTTFINYFFAWAAAMQINFKQEIDPWCSTCPKILAGDGTHIGPVFKHLNMVPIEVADMEETKQSCHRRYNRVFLSYTGDHAAEEIRSARVHLKYLAKLYMGNVEPEDLLDEVSLENQNINLLHVSTNACKPILERFISREYSQSQLQSLSHFLIMLAGDAALSAIIPFTLVDNISESLCNIIDRINMAESIYNIRMACPELEKLIVAFIDTDFLQDVKQLVDHLISSVKEIHSKDIALEPASPIPGSYNPESGISYYFSESGEQMRKLPTYSGFQSDSLRRNFDDAPSESERCRKKYPLVSKSGWSQVFLWFCPMHGHSYGFHIIPRAEGRKDPFASLFKYLPEPPSDIFYDFACSMSEYCLNREPSYFRNSRMWHDIWHGYSHMCGQVFKSRRFLTKYKVNSEICEQFNSYLQCIKYISTHLSQSKFCFLMQMLLHNWNEQKTKSFRKKLNVAFNGSV